MSEEKEFFKESSEEPNDEIVEGVDENVVAGAAEGTTNESFPSNEKYVGPREFVARLEAYAEVKYELQKEVDEVLVENGVIAISDYGYSMTHRLGRLDRTSALGCEAALAKAYDGIYDYDMPLSMRSKTVNIAEAISNAEDSKRIVLNIMEYFALADIDDDASDLEKNGAVAQKIFEHSYPNVEVPDNLRYFESPLGITFIVPQGENNLTLGELATRITASRTNAVENVENNLLESEHYASDNKYKHILSLGGLADVATIPILNQETLENKNYTYGVVFLPGVFDETGSVELDRGTYLHENQHLIDYFLNLDAHVDHEKRDKWLNAEGIKNIGVTLDPQSWDTLKTEIFANNVYDPKIEQSMLSSGRSPYLILTDKEGSYNFEGVLDRDTPIDVGNDDTSESENYKNIVREATDALLNLRYLYQAAFDNDYYKANRMAIGVLDQFPVFDWSRVYEIVKKYSVHDSARLTEEWLKSISIEENNTENS